MALGGSWQSPMRLSAVELAPSKVSRTNTANRRRKFSSVETRPASCAIFEPTEPFFGVTSKSHSGISLQYTTFCSRRIISP